MEQESRELQKKINVAFLKMTLRLIEKVTNKTDSEAPALIKEARECFRLIRELGF